MTPHTATPRHVRLNLESLGDRVVPSATHFFAVGEDIGGSSVVRVYNESGVLTRSITPFAGFAGGVRVATGDVTGDGTDDIVVAAGPGGGPAVKVYDGATGGEIESFFAFEPAFHGGVNVAVGDVNGDGHADIITGAAAGGGPHVEVFDGATGGMVESFFAFEPAFHGGVSVAAGDVNGDGRADVVTGAGAGGGPHVMVFDGPTGAPLASYFAYDPSFLGGITVAAGDVTGSGKADVITGPGFGGGPNVKVLDGMTGTEVNSFFAYDPTFRGGVTVGVAEVNGSNEVLVAPGPSNGGFVELFDAKTGTGVGEFEPFPGFQGGITLGQGVATPAAPFSKVFAYPLAGSKAAQPTNSSSDYSPDPPTGAGDGSNNDFSNVYFSNPIPDPTPIPDTSSYTPPDTSYSPPDDTSYTPPDDFGYTPPDDCGC